MPHDDAVTEALRRLDAMAADPTDNEADFLERLLQQGTCSMRDRARLCRMVERYLPPNGLAAELAGQARLPGLEGAP